MKMTSKAIRWNSSPVRKSAAWPCIEGGRGRTRPFLQKPCLSHQPFLKGMFYWLSISSGSEDCTRPKAL